MNKSNLSFLLFSIAALVYVLSMSIIRFGFNGDFDIYAHISCDPASESCFTTADESDKFSYFKIAFIKAAVAPSCNPTIPDDCPEISCQGLPESQCKTYECSEETIETLELEDTSCRSNESQGINDL